MYRIKKTYSIILFLITYVVYDKIQIAFMLNKFSGSSYIDKCI